MIPFIQLNYSILDDNDRLAIIVHTTQTLSTCGIENDSVITNLHTVFSDMGEKINIAMNKIASSPLTDNINGYHKARVEQINGIQSGIDYFLTHEDDQKVGAAKIIRESYNRYLKKFPNKKKVTYTNAIANFLTDMKEAPRQAALEILDMGEKIALLEEVQLLLVAAIRKRAETEEMDTTPQLSKTRSGIHKMLDVLEHHLYFQQFIDMPDYGELTQKLNGRISEIMATARAKHTQEKNDELGEDLFDQE